VVRDRLDPTGRDEPRDQWYLNRDPIGSMEAWPIVWCGRSEDYTMSSLPAAKYR